MTCLDSTADLIFISCKFFSIVWLICDCFIEASWVNFAAAPVFRALNVIHTTAPFLCALRGNGKVCLGPRRWLKFKIKASHETSLTCDYFLASKEQYLGFIFAFWERLWTNVMSRFYFQSLVDDFNKLSIFFLFFRFFIISFWCQVQVLLHQPLPQAAAGEEDPSRILGEYTCCCCCCCCPDWYTRPIHRSIVSIVIKDRSWRIKLAGSWIICTYSLTIVE